jgi:hypothetical protein
MRKLLTVVLVLVAVTVGLGFYLHWFHLATGGSPDVGKVTVELTIDTDKIKADAEQAKAKAQSLGSKAQAPAPPAAQAGTPGR